MNPAPDVPAGLEWFWEKYHDAVGQIVEFCDACAVPLAGAAIADVGCGEGSMALGLHRRVGPGRLRGFDLKPVDLAELAAHSAAVCGDPELPGTLSFELCGPTSVPVADGEFDFVYSWSAFEHVADPVAVLDEIHRILRPHGHFFLQLWPFYHSAKGSHLWQWFDEEFHHLLEPERDVVARVRASNRQPTEWTDYMLDEFQRLNRITIDALQRAVLGAGFDVVRVELISWPTMLRPELARFSWTDLAIGGVKLLARPRIRA